MDDIIYPFDRPLTLISVFNIVYFTLNIFRVSKMLQKPFQVSQRLNNKISTLPRNVTVWITEYNINYSKEVEDIFVRNF